MKKFLIIGAVFIIIGAGIFTCALASCGFDITKISTVPDYENKEYVFENKNQDIFINEDHDNTKKIVIGKSHDSDIHFLSFENSKSFYKIEDTDNIKIEGQYKQNWYEILTLDFKEKQCSLLLPENYNGNITINNTKSVKANDITINSLNINQKVGNVKMDNVKANAINISSYSGSTEFDNIEAKDISLSVQYGKIQGKIKGDINDYSVSSSAKYGKSNLIQKQ